jgi:hypothetical protein
VGGRPRGDRGCGCGGWNAAAGVVVADEHEKDERCGNDEQKADDGVAVHVCGSFVVLVYCFLGDDFDIRCWSIW